MAAPARADDAVSPTRRAIVIARVLAYDGALASRAGGTLVMGVLYKKGNAASEHGADESVKAFKPLESVMVASLPFRALAIPFTGGAALEAVIEKEGVDTLFLCEGLDADIPAIKLVSHKRKVLTLGTQEAQLKAGVALGVVTDNGKLQIVVNLPFSREEGAEFSSDLLRIARVIK
jgi:hypothetical protein